MTIQTKDVPRVAAAIRTAGELLDVWGELMLTLTADWSSGAKAANLDPDTRGHRWETDDDGQVWAVPSDPTGEAAIAQARADMAPELRKRLARMTDDAQWVRDLAHVLAPIVPPSSMNDRDERWCDHHLRVGLCEPRHRGDCCRFCYDFRLTWNVLPPVSLVRDRHNGKRITEGAVRAALQADGLILQEVGGITKAVRKARGKTGRPNQNSKRKAG